jgi:hypothetical protein
MSIFAASRSASAAMWFDVPDPPEAYVIWPGRLLASATSSLTLLGGNDGCATMIP